MEKTQYKNHMREMRHKRLRAKIAGTATRPRLAVFRSNTAIYAQLINDDASVTLAAADSRKEKGNPLEKAQAVGAAIAKKAIEAKITEIVFDRGGNRYQGSIAALADAARAGGLKF
jgi:large subunit ribosomal protein L18